jgi:hypothetical protein
MQRSEKEYLNEIAVSEIKRNWLPASLWLLFMVGVVGFSAYGLFRAFTG